ncbi:hypothetical protein TNCV_3847541, partial [Trichonephila clavipes]
MDYMRFSGIEPGSKRMGNEHSTIEPPVR